MLHSCMNKALFHWENVDQIFAEVIYPTVYDPWVTDEIVDYLNTNQMIFVLKQNRNLIFHRNLRQANVPLLFSPLAFNK